MSEPILETRDVHVWYGQIHALKGVSLTAGAGEVVALIGGNGAGKSTLLRAISGLVRPREGEILLRGDLLVGLPAHEIGGRGLSHAPEGRHVFTALSVDENLSMGAWVLGGDRTRIERQRERVFSFFPRLLERRRQLAGTLSGGEQQMLAIGRALMADPQVLLLDEPSLGLAPILVERIFATIREIHRVGVSILLVEQNARGALALSDRAYVLETGRVTLSGVASELLAEELEPYGVGVSIVQPGGIVSAIGENSLSGTTGWFRRAGEPFINEAAEVLASLEPPPADPGADQGADSAADAAADPGADSGADSPESETDRRPSSPEIVAMPVLDVLFAERPRRRYLVGTRWEGSRVLAALP